MTSPSCYDLQQVGVFEIQTTQNVGYKALVIQHLFSVVFFLLLFITSTREIIRERAEPHFKGTPPASWTSAAASRKSKGREIYDKSAPIRVQGNTLKTWSFLNPAVERVKVFW